MFTLSRKSATSFPNPVGSLAFSLYSSEAKTSRKVIVYSGRLEDGEIELQDGGVQGAGRGHKGIQRCTLEDCWSPQSRRPGWVPTALTMAPVVKRKPWSMPMPSGKPFRKVPGSPIRLLERC